MAFINCPACGTRNSEPATACTHCGKPLSGPLPPIHGVGGKLQAIGTLTLAAGIIATVIGGWWGPALLFPGLVLFILGRFWD